MPPEESRYPGDWLSLAERDLLRVERCLRDADPEAAAFFLQQAVEKFLKAFLLANGWRLRRVHDLEALLDDAIERDPLFEEFRQICQHVTGYYLVQRYPLLGSPELSAEEVRNAMTTSLPLISYVRAAFELS